MSDAVYIVQLVHAGEIPRDSGLQLLSAAMGLTDEQAEKVMGSAGYSECGLVNQGLLDERDRLKAERDKAHENAESLNERNKVVEAENRQREQQNKQLRDDLACAEAWAEERSRVIQSLLGENERLKENNERQCQKIKDLMDEKAAISFKFYQERFDLNAEIDKRRIKIGQLERQVAALTQNGEQLIMRAQAAEAQAREYLNASMVTHEVSIEIDGISYQLTSLTGEES